MMRYLSKTMTAGMLAITLALTGITATASPASANGHRNNGGEAAAVLGGLLLLYGISQAGRNNTPRHQPQITHQPRHQPVHRVAPGHCFIQGHDNNGAYRGYGYRCMQHNAGAAHLLPQSCLRNVWTNRGQRTIYGGRCLANNGWVRG